MDDYEASDSEYDYSDDDKLLLEDARNTLLNKQKDDDVSILTSIINPMLFF